MNYYKMQYFLPDRMQSAGVAMRAMEHNWKMLFSNADYHI